MTPKLGIAFTLIGALLLVLSIFTYTRKEKVADIGPFHVSVEKKQPTDWMPYVGGLLFIGGIVLIVTSKRSN
ncbi:MAG TPA: hypothetical protein VHB54_09730 [Mucilaginibacter sp.]|nr:hypothetical protein [Mucilaginibacter sp.]HVW14093.1 hypothetical protein [Mucilaginibacter sp.]